MGGGQALEATRSDVEVIRFQDRASLSRDAAYRFAALAAARATERKPFRVVLAGGSTPRLLYKALTMPPIRQAVAWGNVQMFFSDERCVGPDHPYSNFRMVDEALFRPLGLPESSYDRMLGEIEDHRDAAQRYESRIRSVFGMPRNLIPRFDLILLGMGSDGHTASLFPNTAALHERSDLVVASEPGLAPMAPRLTLTLPVLNNAANVIFLVSGSDKAEALSRVLEGPPAPEALPAQSIQAKAGFVSWLIDRDAGALLRSL